MKEILYLNEFKRVSDDKWVFEDESNRIHVHFPHLNNVPFSPVILNTIVVYEMC